MFNFLVALIIVNPIYGTSWDGFGYLIYCPCMGRFGNQAEHFLGSLGFAKVLNRTLILPPWRLYKNEPFNSFFDIKPLKKYHKVVLAEEFMQKLAPLYWPQGQRVGFCYGNGQNACEMKKGQPFQSFWDELHVDFVSYEYFDRGFSDEDYWTRKFPPEKFPVLAFKGAPASFPVKEKYVGLHNYMEWSEKIKQEADSFIQTHFPNKTFIGLHLRNGRDWENACDGVNKFESYMSSYQCYGFNNVRKIDYNVCLPSISTILKLLTDIVKLSKAEVVYISTDNNPLEKEIQNHFSKNEIEVEVYHHNPHLPQVNLAILSRSHHFIGSCVSSFSAFVSRHRKKNNLPTSYWGYSNVKNVHVEL